MKRSFSSVNRDPIAKYGVPLTRETPPEHVVTSACPMCSLKIREWMTTEVAADYLGLSVGALRNMASNGQIPYHKLGRRNRYNVVELRQLLQSQKRGSSHGN